MVLPTTEDTAAKSTTEIQRLAAADDEAPEMAPNPPPTRTELPPTDGDPLDGDHNMTTEYANGLIDAGCCQLPFVMC